MRLINADKVKAESREHCKTCILNGTKRCDKTCVINLICDRMDLQPTIEERPHNEWNNHTVACLLAELFGDPCACNFCGIDEWLPKKCDFANKECPDVVGVACWEQFLKHRKGGAE